MKERKNVGFIVNINLILMIVIMIFELIKFSLCGNQSQLKKGKR